MVDYGLLLTTEQRRSILESRIAQFASEAYQHQLNKRFAIASNNEESILQADEALSILQKAIEIHQEELSSLPVSE